MPLWVKFLLLAVGLIFLGVGVGVGVFGTLAANAHVALAERLRPLSATTIEDQPAGADALVAGTVSPRNRAVFRHFVAYVREELDESTDSDGNTSSTWRETSRETPPLLLEAGGIVTMGGAAYSIERGNDVWYDETTLGFNSEPRDGTVRCTGLVAGGPVVAFGKVAAGREGNELDASALFGGTRDEYLAAQRKSAAILPLLGAIFGAVGLVMTVVVSFFIVRGWRRGWP